MPRSGWLARRTAAARRHSSREADEDTVAILRAEGGGTLRGVLHCFTGGPALAKAGLDLGFHISLAGIITFPKAADLRETVRAIPVDRLLVETDSPFFAPAPYRGKRNEPAHISRVVAALADIHHIGAVAARTAASFVRSSGRDKVPPCTVKNTSPALSQIFEPIRADLEQVDHEFVRQAQSQVELIPKIAKYIQTSGGKRVRPSPAADGGAPERLQGRARGAVHGGRRVHPHRDAGPRRHRRQLGPSPRLAVHSRWGNDITVLLGDYLYIKSMALALT